MCFPFPPLPEDYDSPEHSAKAITDVGYTHIFLTLLVISIQSAYLQEWAGTGSYRKWKYSNLTQVLTNCVYPHPAFCCNKKKSNKLNQYFHFFLHKTIGFHSFLLLCQCVINGNVVAFKVTSVGSDTEDQREKEIGMKIVLKFE